MDETNLYLFYQKPTILFLRSGNYVIFNLVSSDVISELDSFNKLSLEDKDRENSVEGNVQKPKPKIEFIQYESELQMPMIMKIIQKDLSEPYSIYTYRYFIHNWPKLCFLVSS